MRHFLPYAKRYAPLFLIGALFSLFGALGEVTLPNRVAGLINRGIVTVELSELFQEGLVMVGLVIVLLFLSLAGTVITVRASIMLAADIRETTFRKIQELSFTNLDTLHTGSLVTRLTNDVNQIQLFVMQILRMGIRAPAQIIGALLIAFRINTQLAMIIFGVVPILATCITAIIIVALPRFRLMQSCIDQTNTLLQETMTNVRVIKAFVRGDYEAERFDKVSEQLQKAALRANRVMLLQRPSMTLAMNVTTIIIVWLGGRKIIGGEMQVGDLTAFTAYVTQILNSLIGVSTMLVNSSRAAVSAGRIAEVLDTKVDLNDDNASEKDRAIGSGSVEFRNVSFRYFKSSPSAVLSDISFKVESGQTIGLVGSTGSGKTTLIQMIPRLLDPDEGSVLVDGIDVREYGLTPLRNAVSMVLQDNLLFSGSIAENLSWGKEDALESEMAEATETAQIRLFIESLPAGYESELGQKGAGLSGGQKQRMCIARALLKSPQILILDDSTSAVDTATEANIREHLTRVMPNTTKFIIAQRISSVMDADKILVLDSGRLVGEGTHQELLADNTTYQEIYYSQFKREEDIA
ncbi:MAG: ABC transporter ATP-binding protein/permease [Eubacteriaceae bacterium]|nr:ABC transporter ATP-binding protein/permease [Eubacteriaceae bacterium]